VSVSPTQDKNTALTSFVADAVLINTHLSSLFHEMRMRRLPLSITQ